MHAISSPSGTVSASSPEMASRLAAILETYAKQERAAARYRQAVRDGLIQPPQAASQWDISDRH